MCPCTKELVLTIGNNKETAKRIWNLRICFEMLVACHDGMVKLVAYFLIEFLFLWAVFKRKYSLKTSFYSSLKYTSGNRMSKLLNKHSRNKMGCSDAKAVTSRYHSPLSVQTFNHTFRSISFVFMTFRVKLRDRQILEWLLTGLLTGLLTIVTKDICSR